MCISGVGRSQETTYEIVRAGKVVGELTALTTKSGQTTSHNVACTVDLPFNIMYSYTLTSTYEDGFLITSTVKSYLNDVLHRSVSTVQAGEVYQVTLDGATYDFDAPIAYSEAMIYTLEPLKKLDLFSDFLGSTKAIKSMGNHTYKLTNLENGNTSVYRYKNGELKSAEIDFGFLNFTMRKT